MRLSDTLTLAVRSFTNRPKRTFLTVLGVSVGIGAVFALVSFGYGLQQVIISRITTADSLLSLDVTPGSSGLVEISDQHVADIRKMPDVVEIARQKSIPGALTANELTTDAILRAVDENYFRLGGISVSAGELFGGVDDHNDIVISSAVVKLLGFSDAASAVGAKLDLGVTVVDPEGQAAAVVIEEPFVVHGVIDDETVGYAYVLTRTLTSTIPVSTYDGLKVKVASQEVSAAVRDSIIGMGFVVSALSDIIAQANQVFRVVQIVLGLFGLIALFVSSIGMFNTMTITLLERTNEIGIMRSLGVTPADVRLLFIVESMLMGLLGGLGGLLLGFLSGELANAGFNLLAQRLGGQTLDLFAQPLWFTIVILGFSTVIGFLTGVFPAHRASKMDPLEALRYK